VLFAKRHLSEKASYFLSKKVKQKSQAKTLAKKLVEKAAHSHVDEMLHEQLLRQ